jgi:hypothetical protein
MGDDVVHDVRVKIQVTVLRRSPTLHDSIIWPVRCLIPVLRM